MATASWNGEVIAESDEIIHLEGMTYFPPSSIKKSLLKKSKNTYHCPWKGLANYYDVVVGSKTNPGAAWSYHNPEMAKKIKNWYGFWKGVEIKETGKEKVTDIPVGSP